MKFLLVDQLYSLLCQFEIKIKFNEQQIKEYRFIFYIRILWIKFFRDSSIFLP